VTEGCKQVVLLGDPRKIRETMLTRAEIEKSSDNPKKTFRCHIREGRGLIKPRQGKKSMGEIKGRNSKIEQGVPSFSYTNFRQRSHTSSVALEKGKKRPE
jgi:hypothetical protein